MDARVRRLMGERTAWLSGESGAPTPEFIRTPRPEASAKALEPQTRNPGAGDLAYEPAAESRDVRTRLQSYAQTLQGRRLELSTALRLSQESGREFRTAQEDFLLATIRLLIERHRWGPRLFNDTSVTMSGAGSDGDFQHALDVINTLRATQRLPYGGSVEARWVVNATEQLREQATGRYTQASSLVLGGEVPLLRGGGDVAREDLIQAERSLVYSARSFETFRRSLLVQISGDFFRLVQLKATIANAERQIESLRRLEKSTEARVAAGRLDAFQTSIASSRVLASEASLAGLREQYVLALDRFKIRLGLPVDEGVELGEIDLDIPDPAIELDAATAVALDLRLDLQNRRDQLDDARRQVEVARNNTLPDLNLEGSVTLPSDPAERQGLSPSAGDLSYSAGATFSLPLDREIERLGVRQSLVDLERRRREYDEARDTVVVRVRSALRNVEVARFQLSLAEKQVEINRRRLEGQQLKADSLDPQTLVDSLNELLDAENNRDRSRTDLRNAILGYLLESDQLRVSREGAFQPLPGMK